MVDEYKNETMNLRIKTNLPFLQTGKIYEFTTKRQRIELKMLTIANTKQ